MKKRYEIIDLWRTAALLTMLAYHFIYDLGLFGFITWEQVFSLGPQALQRFTCYSFILISGMSCRFSKGNIRRGMITFICAMVVSLVSFIAGIPILFGILHMLGISMILYGLLEKHLEKIPQFAAPFLWIVLFVAAKIWIDNSPAVGSRLLFPLGFTYPGFSSSDYFPLLPWFFLFLAGSAVGKVITTKSPSWLSVPVPKWLTWPGRHTLIVYLLHQPLLYALFYIFIM